MGYSGILLNKRFHIIYTIVTPWGLYEYNSFPMGIVIAIDVFQVRLVGLFSNLPYVIVYIDAIVIVTKGSLVGYFEKIEEVLKTLLELEIQANPLKCTWATD